MKAPQSLPTVTDRMLGRHAQTMQWFVDAWEFANEFREVRPYLVSTYSFVWISLSTATKHGVCTAADVAAKMPAISTSFEHACGKEKLSRETSNDAGKGRWQKKLRRTLRHF